MPEIVDPTTTLVRLLVVEVAKKESFTRELWRSSGLPTLLRWLDAWNEERNR